MKYRYYHNEACSKSRAALALLEEAGVAVECVRYLEQIPTVNELLALAAQLGVSVHELVAAMKQNTLNLPIWMWQTMPHGQQRYTHNRACCNAPF